MDADEEFYYKLRPMAREKDVGSVSERYVRGLVFFFLTMRILIPARNSGTALNSDLYNHE